MEEKKSINTKEIKENIKKVANNIKEKIKKSNIKEETKTAKNYVVDMVKNPIDKIKETANNNSPKAIRAVIVLLVIWILAIFVKETYYTIQYWGLARVFNEFGKVLKLILEPIIGILIYSIIVLILNKKNKKSLIKTITTITITKIPLILSAILSLITIISSSLTVITIPFAEICLITSIILGYFGFKNLFNEEDNTFIKKYILIQIIYYVVYALLGLIGL